MQYLRNHWLTVFPGLPPKPRLGGMIDLGRPGPHPAGVAKSNSNSRLKMLESEWGGCASSRSKPKVSQGARRLCRRQRLSKYERSSYLELVSRPFRLPAGMSPPDPPQFLLSAAPHQIEVTVEPQARSAVWITTARLWGCEGVTPLPGDGGQRPPKGELTRVSLNSCPLEPWRQR